MNEPLPPPRSPWDRPIPDQAPPSPDPVATPATSITNETRPRATDHGRRAVWLLASACVALMIAGAIAFVFAAQDDAGDVQANGLSEVAAPAPESTQPTATVPSSTLPTAAPITVLPTPPTTPPPTTEPTPTTEPSVTVPSTIGPTDVAPGTYSFAEAMASQAVPQHFRMTVATSGVESVVEASIDSHQTMEMTMTAGRERPIHMLMDLDGGVAYCSGGRFDDMLGLLDGDATWLAIDLDRVLAESGQTIDGIRENLTGVNPIAGMVADDVVPLGLTDVDGETLMAYWLALDQEQLIDLIDSNPEFEDSPSVQGLQDAASIDYMFYVTEDNVLMRMDYTIRIYGDELVTKYEYLPIEPGFEIQIPDPSTVQELDDLPD